MAGSEGTLGIVTSVLHVNVLGADHEADRIEERVLRLATKVGGTISAEHGVGVSKAKHLGPVRGRRLRP